MALLSSTSKGYYQACPWFYKLKYVDRLKPISKINTRPFLEGAALHNTLELSYAIKKPLDKAITMGVFDRAWLKAVTDQKRQGELRFNKGETLNGLKAKTKKIVELAIAYINFLGIDKTEFYNEFEIGSYDEPYELVPGLSVQCKIDHVQFLEDYIRIFDYKASKGKDYLKPEQLILYTLAAEKWFGKPVKETSFLMFQLNQKLNVWPTEINKKKVLDDFLEVAHKIDDGVFKANPSLEQCEKCAFRNQCEFSMAKDKYGMFDNDGPKEFDLGEIKL